MFWITLITIHFVNTQWVLIDYSLWEISKFQYSTCASCQRRYSEYFQSGTSDNTANFITCTNPLISYITLNNYEKSIKRYNYVYLEKGDFISFDFYFQGNWDKDEIFFKIGTYQFQYQYTNPTTYPIAQGFCDSVRTDVKTINFTMPSSQNGQIQFTFSNQANRQVSLRYIGMSRYVLNCYPSCSSCTGPENNQCTACYYGAPTVEKKCPYCPNNLYYEKKSGCKTNCKFENIKQYDGFCQTFSYTSFAQYDSGMSSNLILQWQKISDPINGGNTLSYIYTKGYFAYGIFSYNSGVGRLILNVKTSQKIYTYGIKIQIIFYNDLQVGEGIKFMLNNTYYSSIYRNAQGIQTHGLKIQEYLSLGSYNSYSNTFYSSLYMFVDIPQYPFYFSATSNFTNSNVGWGLISLEITSGFFHSNCQIQEVSYRCKQCSSSYYLDKNGNCVQCTNDLQKIVGVYCWNYDEEIPYSKYLIKEYFTNGNDPNQYSYYKLISSTGVNFLKGPDIYYSYWRQQRIFGGPHVWSQAKFERIHMISDPHHKVSISFQIVYGPQFDSNSQFIYQIDNRAPVNCFMSSGTSQSDGSKVQIINERIDHTSNKLTITWECYGSSNEPISAFCGFYRYYIIVHYCSPYCLQCTDYNTCTQMDSYDSNLIKLSQNECQSFEYYDSFSLNCISCPTQCLTCSSSIDCNTCKSNYTLSKIGCVCQINQYDSGSQCLDCPDTCNQCLSSSFCLSCSVTKFQTLVDGQCVCVDGYYQDQTDSICKRCHIFCKTCTGPSLNQCQACSNIQNIQKLGSTCNCLTGTAYQDQFNECAACHSTCLTCFKVTIDGCLACDSTKKRILRGLSCQCQPGYYELNNLCQQCPTLEDSSLLQCYNLCNSNQNIWHTNTCSSCDSGYQLVLNDCKPICGDSQVITPYEQCEDNNTIKDDLCYNCQFQCPKHCLTCDSTTTLPCPDVCGDGIVSGNEECEDGNNIQFDGCYNCKYQCQPACTKCIMGKCWECLTQGWQFQLQTNLCYEQCGDGYITGTEQCEDLNSSDYDGCKDCKYFCRVGCTSCDNVIGKCLSCEKPGYAPESYYCKNICGDGLIVNGLYGYYSEYCDDGNTSNTSRCNSDCSYCVYGYYLGQDKICNPRCGDKIKTIDEICESGNILPYKGCQNCLPKCQPTCLTCDTNGNGCIKCKAGYLKSDNVCHPICGDLIVTEEEDCDDGNLIYGDGCHFCSFSCVRSCVSCIKGVCYLYQEEQDYPLSKCLSIIGQETIIQEQMCILFTDLVYFNRPLIKNLFQCHYLCQKCVFQTCYLCIEGYVLTSNKQECIMQSKFQMEFQYCQIETVNICQQCQSYAYFDIYENRCKLPNYKFNLNDKQHQQVSKCGDGILAYDEECETQNENCLNCQYQKPYKCNHFILNICLECEDGYYYDNLKESCQIYHQYQSIAKNEDHYQFFICQFKLSNYCLICEYGICLKCQENYFLMNEFCMPIQKNEDNLILDYKLESFQCQLFLFGKCIQCKIGWVLQDSNCYSVCGDSIVADDEMCDDGKLNLLEKCKQCKYFCEQYCEICNKGICQKCNDGFYLSLSNNQCYLDEIQQFSEHQDEQNSIVFYQDLDQIYNECNQYCEICKKQKCIECKYGYQGKSCTIKQGNYQISKLKQYFSLNDIYYLDESCNLKCFICYLGVCSMCQEGSYLFNNECLQQNFVKYLEIAQVSVCGDKIVQYGEFCDDGNNIQYDGCFQCHFSCNQYCSKCDDGICYRCQQGFILIEQNCEPECGDGQIMPFTLEECDDINMNQGDGCDNCKFECTPHCKRCNSVHCFNCIAGYENKNEICIPICGDGIVSLDYEECDDQNLIMYDGCYNCRYQCSQDCLKCVQGKCLEKCPDGGINTDGQCTFQCGKLMINYQKECDDGNNIDHDGCFECKFQCIYGCHESFCLNGVCLKCQLGYYLQNQNCYEQGLDNTLLGLIQNQQSSWICSDTDCYYSESPKLIITDLGIRSQLQTIEISIDQEVKTNMTDMQEIFQVVIGNVNQQSYTVTSYSSEEEQLSSNFRHIQYNYYIKYLSKIYSTPILQVKPQPIMVNQYDQKVNQTIYNLSLQLPILLEEAEIQKSLQMQTISQGIMFSSLLLGGLSFVSGESSFVMELFNIIQFQSYLKYINLEYPENLLIYFQASEMLSLSPRLQIFNVDNIISDFANKPQAILDGKFLHYEIEANLLSNITPQIFQIFGIVLMMFSAQYMFIALHKLITNNFFMKNFSNNQKKYVKVIVNILIASRKTIKFMETQKYYFNFLSIKQLLLLNSWDLLFKSILYLHSNRVGDIRSFFESFLSLVIIITYLCILLHSIEVCVKKKFIKKKDRLDKIFETLELCRTFLFNLALILIQNNEVLQILLLFIGSFGQCFFIYKFKQIDKLGKILSVLIEGSTLLFIFTSTIYFQAAKSNLDQNIITTIGFAHIGLLLISALFLGFKQSILTIQSCIKKLMKARNIRRM